MNRLHVALTTALLVAPLLVEADLLVGADLQVGPAQSPPAFEVVSIKPNRSGAAASDTETTPGRITLVNVTPLSLVIRAFGVLRPQIVEAPDWLATERYDVVAAVPEGRVLNDRDRQEYFQRMLTERWKLRYHRDTRKLRVYSLLVSDKAKLLTHTGPGEYGMKVENAGPRVVLRSTRGNMGRLTEILTGFVGNTVSNDTGLTGEYDFVLDWVQDPRSDVPGPSLFTALREQAGLRLESLEKEMPVVVIDQIERPSEN